MKSGNPDTSRYFVLSGRSAVVSDYAANFSQTKKIVNLPGSGFFFFTECAKGSAKAVNSADHKIYF